MREEQTSPPSWLVILLLVLGVVAVVIIALLLAQLDAYQRRSVVPSNGPSITDLEATIAADDLTTIYLPNEASPASTPYATPIEIVPLADEVTPDPSSFETETNCSGTAENRILHIVRRGDSLTSIAGQFGVSEEALHKSNCLAHGQLIQGQQIFIPQTSDFNPISNACDKPNQWKLRNVEPGDTLPKLARSHGTSVYHIIKANCLENPRLSTGSEIYLPDIDQGFTRPSWPIATPTIGSA